MLATLYAAVGLLRHATYRSTGFDLGIFDQAVWQLGRLQEPASSLKDLPSLFGDHFSPILVALAPLGACDCGATPLIVAQALLVAASAVPVVLFARPRLGSGSALLLGLGYGLSAACSRRSRSTSTRSPSAADRVGGAVRRSRAWPRALACVLGLLLVKESLAFLVLAFGLWFGLQRRPREALVCLFAGALWYASITRQGSRIWRTAGRLATGATTRSAARPATRCATRSCARCRRRRSSSRRARSCARSPSCSAPSASCRC